MGSGGVRWGQVGRLVRGGQAEHRKRVRKEAALSLQYLWQAQIWGARFKKKIIFLNFALAIFDC